MVGVHRCRQMVRSTEMGRSHASLEGITRKFHAPGVPGVSSHEAFGGWRSDLLPRSANVSSHGLQDSWCKNRNKLCLTRTAFLVDIPGSHPPRPCCLLGPAKRSTQIPALERALFSWRDDSLSRVSVMEWVDFRPDALVSKMKRTRKSAVVRGRADE
jgi:hypothetical protein